MLVLVLAGATGPWLALVILLPPVFMELAVGNIHILLGVAIAIGFRWPAAWAFVLLTKVTPGIGLLWSRLGASGGASPSWRLRRP